MAKHLVMWQERGAEAGGGASRDWGQGGGSVSVPQRTDLDVPWPAIGQQTTIDVPGAVGPELGTSRPMPSGAAASVHVEGAVGAEEGVGVGERRVVAFALLKGVPFRVPDRGNHLPQATQGWRGFPARQEPV